MSYLLGDIEEVDVPSQSMIAAAESVLQEIDLNGEAILQIDGRRIRVTCDPTGKPVCEEMPR